MHQDGTQTKLPGGKAGVTPLIVPPLRAVGTRRGWDRLLRKRGADTARLMIATLSALADVATILGAGFLSNLLYFHWSYGTAPQIDINLQMVFIVAVFVVAINGLRAEYTVENYLAFSHHPSRLALTWSIAFLGMLALMFLTKSTGELSRFIGLTFFGAGLVALTAQRYAMVKLVAQRSAMGASAMRHVVLFGREQDIEAFNRTNDDLQLGCRVIGISVLRESGDGENEAARLARLDEDVSLAVSTVRLLKPDDVFLLVAWSDAELIERCVEGFVTVPAALHLRPELVMERFGDVRVGRVGRLLGINVGRKPIAFHDVMLKRTFDIVVALAALVLLSPLLVALAILIKLDSPGPVFFIQRRYGFNQEAFRVLKFRSMIVNDGTFQQATRDDPRITRLGAFLRRWNFDELPQLFNVVIGNMSLVGPRPHALAHDRAFEQRIARYAARHNVKPGITGWAQVNGFRGETRTQEEMMRRVEHDLYYIDNWSLRLDIRILFMTVFSPKAYRNAY